MRANQNEPVPEDMREFEVARGMVDANPPVNWTTLSKFVVRVKSETNVIAPVYANGRQEVPVEIEIEARDEDGVVVNLTHSQLSYVRMIEYLSGNNYKTNYFKNNYFVYEWAVAREDGSEVDPDGRSAGDGPVITGQTTMRYVPLSQVETVWLAAELESPSSVVFRTNTPNPSPGKFDSWVKVDGRTPNVTHWEQFAISERKILPTDDDWIVFMYYIYFKDPKLRIAWSNNYRPNVEDIHYRTPGPYLGVVHAALLYGGGSPTFTYTSCSSTQHSITFPIDARPGQAQAAIIFDKLGKSCTPMLSKNGLMGYMDQYGNESKITLKVIKGNERGHGMRLDDPANVDYVTPDEP